MRDYVNSTALQEYTTKLVAKLKTLFPGTPTAAATVADMTDHSKTYVYVGSETGYTAGDWYYWDGSAWTSGGPFQATSIITDTTLAVAGEAADAKATGDAIAAAKTAVLNAMAPAYSTSATYAVGDYVNYNGSIYRCTTAITTAESWTAGHWTAVVLGADLASQVSDLKTQISYAVETTTGRVKTDIYNSVTWTDGYVTDAGVVYNGGTTYYYTNKIPVSEGDVFSIDTTGGKTIRYITAYTGDSVVSAASATYVGNGGYTVPNGVNGVIITLQKEYGVIALYHEKLENIYKNILEDDVNDNTEKISAISDTESYTKETETQIIPTFTSGYMDTGGTPHAGSSYEYTQKISVSPGQIVSVVVTSGSANMRFLCAYSGNTAVNVKGVSADTAQYTVPDGIDGIVLTCYADSNVDYIKITEYSDDSATYVKRIPFGYMMSKDDLSDGESLSLPNHNSKNYNRVVFDGRVASFNAIKIVKGLHSFEVNATNVVLTGYGATPLVTVPHGLTISDTISILIENDTDEKTSLIRVSSKGAEFSYTTPFEFNVGKGAWTVISDGSTLSNCVFSWTSKVINTGLWLFGDSYFSFYTTRWTYYLIRDGFADHCMLNGFAGENSLEAIDGLKNLIKTTVPKIVVWCLGMNDPDTGSAVNSNWKSAFDTVVNLQKQYGFELILYTVPTTPSINNDYKNTIIRASGFRYIDIDSAVRIDGTRNWISGALADDEVHPTAEGAKIIYYKVLADLPEIMSRD